MNDVLSDPEIQAEIGGLLNVDKLDFTHTLEPQPHTKAPMPSVLHSIIDLVSRTEYASANVANFLSEAPEHYSGRAGPLQPIQFMTPEERKRVFSLAWKGITGEEKHTYDELVERRFPQWNKPKQFAVSLLAAIALDPLTYIPASVVSKPAKMIGELKPVQKAAKALEATKLGEAFIPYAGTSKEFKNFMNETRFEKQFEVDKVLTEIKELNRGLIKEDREMFSYYRQHPDKVDLMPPHLQAKLETIGSRFDNIIEESYARGSITDAQYKAWKVREGTYLPGVYKGQKRLSGVLPPDYTTAQPSFLKQKRFETLEDAKALANDFTELSKATSIEGMRKLADERGIDFAQAFKASETHDLPLKAYTSQAAKYAERYTPEEDILKLYGVRKLEDIAWKMRDEFLDNVVSQFGKQIPWDTKVLPEGYGIYFPKGQIRFYPRTSINMKAMDTLSEAINSFKKLSEEAATEVTRKTTVTKTVGPSLSEADKTKAAAVWETRVKEAMQNRGFSEGEANIAIEKIRETGGKIDPDRLVETITETTEETFRKAANMDDLDDLVPAAALMGMIEKYPSVTRNVPAYMLPDAIAREVNRASRAFIGDSTTNWLLNMYDTALNAWKSMATSVRVPFHLRNFYSNLFLSHQAGINNPSRFLEALDVQQAMTWKLDKKFQFGKYTYTADQLNRALHFLGVRGTGWLGSDIEKQALGEIDWLLKGPQKAVTHPFKMVGRGGRAVGTAIEDNARIAVFIDQLKKGATPTEASRQVRKYLFDYSDLTPFERDVMKRVRPFYTWCVSSDTECLTKRGWMRHSDISIGDEILTYNIKKKLFEWQNVEDKFESFYNYNLLHFKGKSIDLLCTFDHNCLTANGLRKAYEVSQVDVAPMKVRYEVSDYDIPDRMLELIAWIITDGYSRKRGGRFEAVIYQKKVNYLKEIKQLASPDFSTSVHPKTGTTCVRLIGNTRLELLKYFEGREKVWDIFVRLSARQLQLMYNIMMKAEGSTVYQGHKKAFKHFAQQNLTVLDCFQLVTILSGVISSISSRGIYLRKKETVQYRKPQIVKYCGIIWCPTTNNGTWVARRNGKVIITGNTRKNLALQSEMIVRKPKVYSRYAKMLRAYDEPEAASELTNKPAYFDKMMYRKTAMRTAQGKPIYAALDLPPLIFNQIVDPRDFMASLGPYRTIGELIVNKKFFPELTDIEKKPGALVRAPVWIQALPEKVTNYLEMHKILSPMLDVQSGKMVLGIRGKYLYAINGAFPLFSEMGRVYAEPITLSDERPEMWKRTYLTGISQKAFDASQAAKQRLFQQGEIEDRINFYVRQRDALPSKQEISTLFPEEELRKIVERDFKDLFTD